MASQAFKALHLYTTPLSGCSARIRIAAHLKNIPLIHHSISLAKLQQTTPAYLSINPNGSVPSLIIEPYNSFPAEENKNQNITITQSPAILDFLEAHFPTPPLLPPSSQVAKRARVLELTSLVACDIQPPQNSRIRRKIVEDFGGDGEKWARYVYERGFGVYEELLRKGERGRYSVGDKVTLADMFLVPAAQGGMRVGVDLEKWPLVKGVVDACWEVEAFRKGGLGEHGRLIP
ncbi:maleylacetoacetate isomerase maia [Rhexocercosporidium sp. MPI-PUGE-AT-0058]|nr:maleylacetoacetate isomerase maia [Rhexocercosporidium sp. MPI-PUGE-AT-0058]